MTYYKWLGTGRTAYTGFQWPECGEWVTVQGEIIPCENGIHYCRESDLLWWINADLYTFERVASVADPMAIVRLERG